MLPELFEGNVMKIKNEIDALETNMMDIETLTRRMVENHMTDIKNVLQLCVTGRTLSRMLNQSDHAWIPYLRRPLLKNTLPANIQILVRVTYLNIT